MSEEASGGRRDVSRSARGFAAGSPRRNATTDDGPRSGVHTSEQTDLETDDSFSEERFISAAAMQNTSWESHSFDSEERARSSRPSSRTSSHRDRRKQFDTTTPTLIDEFDVDEGNGEHDEQEMMSLEQSGLQGFDGRDESSLRRTPGATMYKSALESESDVANMRRTPGASAMQRSLQPAIAKSQPSEEEQEREAVGLGFGLTLSTPLAGDQRTDKPRIWQTYPHQSRTPSPGRVLATEGDQTSVPSLAPPQSSVPGGINPFFPTTWTAQSASEGQRADGQRTGAFSPNILRLTENLGNLLHEDEDDDFRLEIPSFFRGASDDKSEVDWTGSYVFDSNLNRQTSRPAVPRPSTTQKEGKPRRRPGSGGGGTFLANAQQPKPRRSGNEVFEFGMSRTDERASPQQPLHFGGAFVPPSNTGNFVRPVASSAANQGPLFPQPHTLPQQQGHFQVAGPPPQSFDSFQPGQAHEPTTSGFYMQQRIYAVSPSFPMINPTYGAQQSEMQATAREFVPMASRSTTPQYSAQQQWPQAASVTYDPPLEQASWNTSTAYNGYGGNYSYQASASPARSSVTSSPHLPAWQSTDSNVSGATVQRSSAAAAPAASAQAVADQPTRESTRGKKDTKRGKRGKKKSQQRTESSAGAGKKTVGATKKKGKGDLVRPGSTTQDANEEGLSSAVEDPVDAKRAELVESPSTRIAFKDFYRSFRSEERQSFQKAEEFALGALEDRSLPDSIHWRVYLELADLAKRSNRYIEARRLYQKVCQLQPYASQGWLEYSKLEEECGHMNRVMNILHAGLEHCEYSETLLTRAVKHQEKLGNLTYARGLLARLKHVGIDRVWRTVLEGALLEARAGNVATARRVLKYLMHHVPWYGPLYLEAYRLERDQGHPLDALQIVERGLRAIPRYGPLWFGSFRLCEAMDIEKKNYHLPHTMEMIERAKTSISKELVWKVHLEAAQMLERAALEQAVVAESSLEAMLAPVRHRLALTVLTCPNNLRWKVWLAAARMELGIGNTQRARALFMRAHKVVPERGRSATLLECARLEEFIGDTALARAVLCKGRVEYGHDWKVWLEGVLLEMRNGDFLRAIDICVGALELHQGTGRLWASLVQLSHFSGRDKSQYEALRRALNAVPKSGEVWCEGGRVHLNPFSDTFDLERARRHLHFATKFTPQYGDSFIESLRLEILVQWLSPIAEYVWEATSSSFLPTKGNAGEERLITYVTEVSRAIALARRGDLESDVDNLPRIAHRGIVPALRKLLKVETLSASIDLSGLRLTCSNADPNYGSLWFYCRRGSTDTPRRVIEDAAAGVADEIHKFAHVYLAAAIRRKAVIATVGATQPPSSMNTLGEASDPKVAEWEKFIDERLRMAPSLEDMFNPVDPTTGSVLLESTISGSLFITALSDMSKHQDITGMRLTVRRRALFGNDALFP